MEERVRALAENLLSRRKLNENKLRLFLDMVYRLNTLRPLSETEFMSKH